MPYNQEEAAHYALTGDQIRDAVSQYDSNEVDKFRFENESSIRVRSGCFGSLSFHCNQFEFGEEKCKYSPFSLVGESNVTIWINRNGINRIGLSHEWLWQC